MQCTNLDKIALFFFLTYANFIYSLLCIRKSWAVQFGQGYLLLVGAYSEFLPTKSEFMLSVFHSLLISLLRDKS